MARGTSPPDTVRGPAAATASVAGPARGCTHGATGGCPVRRLDPVESSGVPFAGPRQPV